MARLKNGMIVFMRDQEFPGFKLFDIEVTNAFPLVALTKRLHLVNHNGDKEVLEDFDHIAFPPDLRLHITSPKEHIFFDVSPLNEMLERDDTEAFHYFTVVGLPSCKAINMRTDRTRVWNGGVIISPFKDEKFTDATRLFVDFYIHKPGVSPEIIEAMPLAMREMRLARDRGGAVFGPFSFASIQRRNPPADNIGLSMRFGYVELEDDDSMYLYTPLAIYERRVRA